MKIPEAINSRLRSRRFGELSPERFALDRKEDHMNQIMKRNGKRNKVKNRKYDYAAMITMAVLLLMPMNAFAAAQVRRQERSSWPGVCLSLHPLISPEIPPSRRIL